MKTIRPSYCAGTWYQSNGDKLRKSVESCLQNAKNLFQDVKAVIAPHAGYMYSGSVAAKSFKQISVNTKKIIALGTAHRYFLKGVSVCYYDYLKTPLGEIKVSKQDLERILKFKNINIIPEADINEHSIEILLPFLQITLNNFEIVPMIVGEIEYNEFSEVLESLVQKNTVIVVSVDLSHFHDYETAKILDESSIKSILNLKSDNILNSEIDSPFAVASLLRLAEKMKWKPILLDYTNSGNISGDLSSVVGYCSVCFVNNNVK